MTTRIPLLLLLLFAASMSAAQVPTTLSYQGRLLDDAGQVVAGPVDVVVSLWTDATGGTELWSETWPGVPLSNGVFSLLLGSNGSPIDPADFQGGGTLFLQLEIDGEVLLPRQVVGSAPFALVDEPGNELQDLSLDGDVLGLSGSAATVDLSAYRDDTDTDAQDLALAGDMLTLTNDPTPVDLSPYLDDTDEQQLTLVGSTLSLTDGGSVDLSGSRERVMFVTSQTYAGDLGGLAGADAKCQSLASAAELAGTYQAWLATAASSPASRFAHNGSFVRVDGAEIAADWDDLTDGSLAVPIDVTETGATLSGTGLAAGVWTNVGEGGGGYGGPLCGDWTVATTDDEGLFGRHDATDGSWTAWSQDLCSLELRLYCVQEPNLVGPDDQVLSLDGDTLQLSSDDGPDLVDLSEFKQTLTISGSVLTLSGAGSIDLATREERRVFITSTSYDGALGGLAGADAKCQARADAAGLAGSFQAWLSDESGSPSSRFDRGGSFVRLDGVVVADDWADLTDGALDAPIQVDELGVVVQNPLSTVTVWTATATDGTHSTYTGVVRNCSSWSSSSSDATAHVGTMLPPDPYAWTDGAIAGCGNLYRLYCFEIVARVDTDDQQLSLSGSTLSLTDGGSVDLSGVGADVGGTLTLANGVAPTSSPADAVQLYAEDVGGSSELKVRDEAGNVTTLSPHNFSLVGAPSEPLAWSYYSESDAGRINVDMLRVVRLLEEISGEQLVHARSADGAPVPSPGEREASLRVEIEALKQANRALARELARIEAALGLAPTTRKIP